MAPKKNVSKECYDYPQYWDLAFRDETAGEIRLIEAVKDRYCGGQVTRVLEPGCGGGRLIVELAARGYEAIGFDLNAIALNYLRKKLRRRGLSAEVFQGDMSRFEVSRPVDLAINPVNTFRHLVTEQAARSHLECIADCLRTGGVYLLGLHLEPDEEYDAVVERWTAKHGKTQVTTTVRVLDIDAENRVENVRFSLRVRSGERDLRFRSDHHLRLYTAREIRDLVESLPQFELCDVFDFWYDIDRPQDLDGDMEDTLLVLRKR